MPSGIYIRTQEHKDKLKKNKRFLGKKHTTETKLKISKSKKGQNSGEKSYQWIKDRTQLKDDSKERGGQLHREWSKSVKDRDGWICRIQNKDCSGRMESHHILSWKDHPELRYKINNGITLCHFHHPRKREDEINLSPYFQKMVAEFK